MAKISFKELTLNSENRTCFIENKSVNLSKKEYLLLQLFLENQNKVFTREEIIDLVWRKQVSIRTIDVTLSRLRKKLKEYSHYLVTRSGFGYGLITD